GNACCRKSLRHRSALQCVLQDRVVSYRHVNRYVDHHDFLLADLVRGWLSETRGLPSRDQMSASGPKRTCASALHISAFGGKADISRETLIAPFDANRPKRGPGRMGGGSRALRDHLGGGGERRKARGIFRAAAATGHSGQEELEFVQQCSAVDGAGW